MMRVSVCDGKYVVTDEGGKGLHALRHGEAWRELTGDKLVYCLAHELQEAREEAERAQEELLGSVLQRLEKLI